MTALHVRRCSGVPAAAMHSWHLSPCCQPGSFALRHCVHCPPLIADTNAGLCSARHPSLLPAFPALPLSSGLSPALASITAVVGLRVASETVGLAAPGGRAAGNSRRTLLNAHLSADLVAAATTAAGGSTATSIASPRSSRRCLPSLVLQPSLRQVAAKAAAGPATAFQPEPVASLILRCAFVNALVRASLVAQPSHQALAQERNGRTLPVIDGSTAVVDGASACMTSLGFLPLAGGVTAAAASLTIVSSAELATPVQSPP